MNTRRLDERLWIYAGGVTAQWQDVSRRRIEEALARLRAVVAVSSRRAPAEIRRSRYLEGPRYFLRRADARRDRLAAHPGIDRALSLCEKNLSDSCGLEAWKLHLEAFHGYAAWLALSCGDTLVLDSALDADARFNLYGSPFYLQYPAALARQPIRIRAAGRRMEVRGPGRRLTRVPLRALNEDVPLSGVDAGPARLARVPEAVAGITIEQDRKLLVDGISVHGLAQHSPEAARRFGAVIKAALEDIAKKDPRLYAEITDMVRVVVPLRNPKDFGSVSSSYVDLRGAICLSHSEDPLLQAETLIHEFSHQKMNQLLVVDPILVPGQGGQVFYSPWREDPRRLRGLLLGAHAFLNVARYLMAAVSRESYRREASSGAMLNTALRLGQVEEALRTAVLYGSYTEFGRRFVLGLWRELGGLLHSSQWFPQALREEARARAGKHRASHALFDTGLHRGADFSSRLQWIPVPNSENIPKKTP